MKRRALGWGLVLVLASACGSSADAPSEAPPPTPIVPRPTVAPPPPPSSPPPNTPPTTVAPPSGVVGLGSALGPSSGEWSACATDADCVLVRTPCGGDTAANRAHAEEMQRGYDAMIPLADCARGAAAPTPMEPACVSALCVARPVLGGLGASGTGVGGS